MSTPLRVTRPPDDDSPGDSTPLLDTPASDIRTSKTSWLWPDRLEWGTVAFIQGPKGVGKSTWLRAIAADVTGGPRIPGTKGKKRHAGNVLYYAGEESLSTRVVPGLKAAGAVLNRCYLADCYSDDPQLQLQLPNDCERLEARIRDRKAKLVVIDPVFTFVDGTCDLGGPTQPARLFMRSVAKVAAATGSLILLSRNLTKDSSNGAVNAGRGGGELGNAARAVLHLQRLPDDPNTCALSVAACNNGRPTASLTYALADAPAGQVVIRSTGESNITADELVAGEEGALERTMLDRAKALIMAMIPSGKLDSRVVKAKAEAAMIGLRTLQAAAKSLGVRMPREGSRESTVTYWSPPKGGWGG